MSVFCSCHCTEELPVKCNLTRPLWHCKMATGHRIGVTSLAGGLAQGENKKLHNPEMQREVLQWVVLFGCISTAKFIGNLEGEVEPGEGFLCFSVKGEKSSCGSAKVLTIGLGFCNPFGQETSTFLLQSPQAQGTCSGPIQSPKTAWGLRLHFPRLCKPSLVARVCLSQYQGCSPSQSQARFQKMWSKCKDGGRQLKWSDAWAGNKITLGQRYSWRC